MFANLSDEQKNAIAMSASPFGFEAADDVATNYAYAAGLPPPTSPMPVAVDAAPPMATPVTFRPDDGQMAPPVDPSAYTLQPAAEIGAGGGGSYGNSQGGAVYGQEALDLAMQDRARAQALSANGQAGLDAAAGQQRDAIEGIAAINERYAPMRQDAVNRQTQALATNAEASAKLALEQQNYMAKADEQLTGMTSELANSKVDPQRLWNSKSTGSKINAALMTFVSGLSQAFTGDTGANKVLGMIQRDIDQDIAQQQSTYQIARNALGDKLNMVSMAKARFGDSQQALTAARIAALETTKSQLMAIDQASGNEAAKLNTQLLVGKLDQQIMDKKIQFGLQTQELGAKATAQVASIQQTQSARMSASGEIDAKMRTEDRARYVPGLGFALTAEDAKVMKDAKKEQEVAQGNFATIRNLYERRGASKAFSPQTKAELQKAAETLRGKIQKLESMGALGEAEAARLKERVPDPSEIGWTDITLQQFMALEKQFTADFAASVANRMEPGRYKPYVQASYAQGGEGRGNVPTATPEELEAARAETARRRAQYAGQNNRLRVNGAN
jgi:hypothetical protein